MLASAVAAISLGLLASSGIAKLLDPEPTTGAMKSARLPASHALTFGLGLAEIAAGVAGLVLGGPAVVTAAVLYAGFSVFTFMATRKRIPLQSCGCFGRDDTPPGYLHVIFNVTATVSLISITLSGAMPIDWAARPLEVALSIAFTGIGVFASYLLLARLPQVLELARQP